jgi:hypothetical protein
MIRFDLTIIGNYRIEQISECVWYRVKSRRPEVGNEGEGKGKKVTCNDDDDDFHTR